MNKIEKNFYLKFLLASTWVSFFLSINLNPIEFFEYNLIGKVRLVLPLILSIIFILVKIRKIKIKNFFVHYSYFFYLIFFLYIFFTLTSPNNNNLNIYWPLYMLLSFFILHNFLNSEEKLTIFKLTIMIIALGFAFYFSASILEMITNPRSHFYGVMGHDSSYFGFKYPPRSSGLARLALILFSFVLYYYLINKKKKNYILLFLLAFLGIFSLIYQSRTISFIYILLNIFTILFYFKKFFFDKRLLIFALIIPFLVNFSYNYFLIHKAIPIKEKINISENRTNIFEDRTDIAINAFNNILLRDQNNYKKNPSRFSSDRFYNWKKAYNIIKKNYLKGYGAQADRLLIDQSIHNSILYTTLAAGIVGGLTIIFIYIYSLILLIKFYFTDAYKLNNSPLMHFAASILFIICLRSFLETSIAVFSIDFLVYIIALLFFSERLKKYQ